MAKAKTTEVATPEKKVRVKKAEGPKTIQLDLSTNGNPHIKQTVSHVRSMGVLVTTVVVDAKGIPTGGVNTVWIPGLKPKSKKGERFLVQDKGPKPKKEKATATDKKAK